jgi:cysteine sulfinate desulfinase/cysteine desulfurase-like protein
MKTPVYPDYNATTPIDQKVAEAMWPYVTRHCENPSSSYKGGHAAKQAIENARKEVPRLINANPEEIIFYQRRNRIKQPFHPWNLGSSKKERKHIIRVC